MKYEVITRRLTRPDSATVPGGIAIWKATRGMFGVSHFSRARGSETPLEMFWSSYHENEDDAREAFAEKLSRAAVWQAGGSIIPLALEADELAAELAQGVAA